MPATPSPWPDPSRPDPQPTDTQAKGGPPNKGTDADRRLKRNADRKPRPRGKQQRKT